MSTRVPLRVWTSIRSSTVSSRAHFRPQFQLRKPIFHVRATPSRNASTAQTVAADGRSVGTRLKNLFYGTTLVLALSFTYLYVTDTRASIHRYLLVPLLRLTHADAEDAHHFGTSALKALYSFGLHPRERSRPDEAGELSVEVFGHTLDNPVGTSGGIDKDADIPSPLFALGAAVVEVGGVTPHPQEGNPKPRVWRLPSQNALINRYGLNSEGAEHVAMQLRQRVREFAYHKGYGITAEAEQMVLDGAAGVPPGSLMEGRLLAVQVSKNKTTPDGDIAAVKRDFVTCVEHLARYADVITVNVSSPNTPGLRQFQKVGPLTEILSDVVDAARKTERRAKPAVMVKVSPDEDSDEQISGICEAVWESGVDGVIVGNTTKTRPDALPAGFNMPPKEAQILLEQGGYSGPQMFERTLGLVKKYRRLLDQGPKESSQPKKEKKQEARKTDIARNDEPVRSSPGKLEAIAESEKRDAQRLKPLNNGDDNLNKQPLIRLPEQSSLTAASSSSSSSSSSTATPTPSKPSGIQVGQSDSSQKVIFATGGITNGQQALAILNAGASVAMVYTALIYGGVGTITRIKEEMRDEIKGKSSKA